MRLYLNLQGGFCDLTSFMHHPDRQPESLPDSFSPVPSSSAPSNSQKPSYRFLKLGLFLVGAIALAVVLNQIRPVTLLQPIQNFVFWSEDHYHQWYERHSSPSMLALLLFAFLGGLVASISPCILALLPVNLSYIGTRTITSRRDALGKAIAFVLGVVTVLSVLGLMSSVASFVLLRAQGYVYLAVGTLILWMGLNLLGWVPLQLPQVNTRLPLSGAYGVGVTFALVTSPCTSPFLFSVLGMAATAGSQVQSVLTMVSYALGYTAVLFAASVLTGFAKQAQLLLPHSERLIKIGAGVLLLTGTYYLVSGLRWVVLMHTLLGNS